METAPNTSVSTMIRLDTLLLDPELQVRAQVDEKVVREYAERMRDGAVFPPILVFQDPDSGEQRVVDGFHRARAAQAAQRGEILAEVRPGNRREALLTAVGCNANHGLRRTHEDKHKAVQVLFDDPEWQTWSDGEIARRCGVSQPFVSRQRGLWRARRCTEQRAEFQQAATHNGYESGQPAAAAAPRRCRRAGREYVMDTGKIGKQRSSGETPATAVLANASTQPQPQPEAPAMRIAAAMAAATAVTAGDLPEVFPHRWWRLGGHRLLCGPADHRFAAHVPEAPLALCGAWAPAAGQSGGATTEWIARRAAVVALHLDNAVLLITRYPAEYLYRRTIAALAPGADGGGETWHPVVLFAPERVPLRIPDVLRLVADPSGDVALPADLTVQLLQYLTTEGDPVIDPALGDGVTLLAAEATGRICWGAEPDPERCGRIIRAWERLTGETAVPSPVLSRGAA